MCIRDRLTVETERLMNVTLCGPKAALETLTPEQVVVEIDAEMCIRDSPPAGRWP